MCQAHSIRVTNLYAMISRILQQLSL